MSEYRIVMAKDMIKKHPELVVGGEPDPQDMADILNLLYLYQKLWGFDEAGLNSEQLEAGVKWLAKVRETTNE